MDDLQISGMYVCTYVCMHALIYIHAGMHACDLCIYNIVQIYIYLSKHYYRNTLCIWCVYLSTYIYAMMLTYIGIHLLSCMFMRVAYIRDS